MCVFACVCAKVCVCVPSESVSAFYRFFVPFHIVMYCIVYYIFMDEKNIYK